jgi:hypothetical protein
MNTGQNIFIMRKYPLIPADRGSCCGCGYVLSGPDFISIQSDLVQVIKSLTLQNHSLFAKFVDNLFQLLSDKNVGWDAARAIGLVVSRDNVLTKPHHAVIKVGS